MASSASHDSMASSYSPVPVPVSPSITKNFTISNAFGETSKASASWTSVAAGFRASLEGYARAGIRYVELTLPLVEELAS